MPELAPWMGSWLLAYLVHSSLWLGGAWLLTRLRPQAAPRSRELVWKSALVGSLLTPTLALTLFAVAPTPPAPATTAAGAPGASPSLAAPAVGAGLVPVAPVAEPTAGTTLVLEPRALESADTAADTPAGSMPARLLPPLDLWLPAMARALPWLWVPFALLGLLAMGGAQLRLWRLLRDRQPLERGPLARRLRRMVGALPPGRSVRLTVSRRLAVPVAFGLRRAEICLPERALEGLDAQQQASMLGHELHHLLRRDPLVLALVQGVARLLWLQPLNFLALRELRLAAEECCDAWAAGRTGDPVAMAACLGEVAGWLLPARAPLPAACMARPGSPLARRIERLLDARDAGELTPPLSRGQRFRAAGGFAAGLLLLPTLLPVSSDVAAVAAADDLELAWLVAVNEADARLDALQPDLLHLTAQPPVAIAAALAAQFDLLQQELAALRDELWQQGSGDGVAALRLHMLQQRLARLQTRLQQALAGLSPTEDLLADPDPR